MDFPNKGFLYKKIVKGNLKSADVLLATSPTIVAYIHQLVETKVHIIPFGINTEVFKPLPVNKVIDDSIVIGTVKSLESIYRIDLILKAFAKVKNQENIPKLKLLIVGGGSLEQELKQLANDLHIEKHVFFIGKVSMDEVPKYHNMIDIFVNVSDDESFGVSVLEASACARPVIVTKVGGLRDVMINNETGIMISKDNEEELTEAIIDLVLHPDKRKTMGIAGREFVQKNYELMICVKNMLEIYNAVLTKE
jgi:glycosyltransferase involved in cell wall biosynthesis